MKPLTHGLPSSALVLSLKTRALVVDVHQHSAWQVVYSLDHPFDAVIDQRQERGLYGFILPPQVPHRCDGERHTLLVMNVEAFSAAGARLAHALASHQGGPLLWRQPSSPLQTWPMAWPEGEAVTDPHAIGLALHRSLCAWASPSARDERVALALALLARDVEQRVDLRRLARQVHLSPSRLGALCKAQTGSSLNKHLLWMRLRHAIRLALGDSTRAGAARPGPRSLSDIALMSGFYDLPQLDRTMNAMMGVSPSILRRHSDLIQAYPAS